MFSDEAGYQIKVSLKSLETVQMLTNLQIQISKLTFRFKSGQECCIHITFLIAWMEQMATDLGISSTIAKFLLIVEALL